MPGRTPSDAFSAFVTPLADALKCVALGKIEHSPGGNRVTDKKHSLYITGRDNEGYTRLRGVRVQLRARMFYLIVTDDRPDYGPFRVTTAGYDYSVQTTDGTAVVDYHWHPVGLSHEVRPHLHLGSAQLREDAVLARSHRMLIGRITFESVIRNLIGLGVEARYDDWAARLDLCETPHVLHRSWSVDYERETGKTIER